jgi:hypothetical protein
MQARPRAKGIPACARMRYQEVLGGSGPQNSVSGVGETVPRPNTHFELKATGERVHPQGRPSHSGRVVDVNEDCAAGSEINTY